MKKFINKTVLITGASRGIGRATAILFAKEGANIVINYLTSQEEANDLVSEINSIGAHVFAINCDVSKEIEVKNMIDEVVKIYGSIDILVNNAGIVKDVPMLERNVKEWEKTLGVNLIGPFLCIKHASESMKLNGGRIINISSTSALYSFSPDIVDYDASKAGVIALTKNFAKAFAPKILVNAIAPGWVDTDINKTLPEMFKQQEKDSIYLKRFANPEEIAKVVLFLASEDASFITGSVIVVDGGHD